jgi:putative ATP-dependent endonuclease of the OLD family
MFDAFHDTKDYLDKEYIPKKHGQKLDKNTARDYRSQGGHERALIDALSENKTQYGKPLAEAITSITDESLRFPKLIRSLFERISIDIGLPKREVKHS